MLKNNVFRQIFLLVFVLLAMGWLLGRMPTPEKTFSSTLSTVRQTGVIRCGYWTAEPFIRRDPISGTMSGLTVDYLEQAAERHGLKIRWEREIPIDQIAPALQYGHIDAFCLPCTPTPEWERVLDFAGSFGEIPLYIYVPKNSVVDKEALKQNARFAVIDGYALSSETIRFFPNARLVSLPNTASLAELYDQLRFGKADAVVSDPLSALHYMRENAKVMRRLDETPLSTNEVSFPVKKGDSEWAGFLHEMTDTKAPANAALFDSLLKKYGVNDGTILR